MNYASDSAIILAVAAAALLFVGLLKSFNTSDHSCNAPCTVHFKDPVAEDDVKWDWTKHNNALVWKDGNH